MKKIIIVLIIIAALAGGGFFFLQHRTSASKPEVDYKFDVISRGDITNLVSSTGTLNVVGTVEVGTQASGTVDQVLVDYNDTVKKGQLLVVMDKTLLNVAIQDAEAALARSKVQLSQAETEYQRNEILFKEGYVSEMTMLTAKTTLETAKSSVISSEAALKKAKTNLKYTEIRSPINGTVIQMNVDAGQTISPNSEDALLTIAEDLSHMQIEALVDESDISQIKEGMPVRFTVQAYADKEFDGTVRQVRLKPKTVSDVVNYTVIIDAANDEGILLPGMTATVDFIVEERQNVLMLPNTALSFKPSEELMAQLRPQFQRPTGANQGTNETGTMGPQISTGNGEIADQSMQPPQGFPIMAGQQGITGTGQNAGQPMQAPQGFPGEQGTGGFPMGSGMGQNANANASTKIARVFYLDDNDKPKMARVVTGATDGSKTEIIEGAQLYEGVRVITGTNTTTKKTSEKQSGMGFGMPGLGGGAGGPPPGAGGPP